MKARVALLLLLVEHALCFLPHASVDHQRSRPSTQIWASKETITTTTRQRKTGGDSRITSDAQVIRVLDDLRVDPPWKGKGPNISTRTFNFVLRQLLLTAGSGGNSNNNNNNRNIGQQAESILKYMVNSKRKAIQPDLVSLNTVLAIYSKQASRRNAQAAVQADALRQEWETWYQQGRVTVNTDLISLNTVMSAFVRVGSLNDARRIFGVLWARHENDDSIKPDAVSYGTLLRGYAQNGRVRDAEALFQKMKNEGPRPTVECFNEVLYAYSKSSLPGRAEEFLKVWTEDLDEPVRPDVRSYNIVLHALSNNQDPSSILRAERLLNRMPSRDAASYTTFIHLCCRLPGHMALDATDRALQKASRDTDVVINADFLANVMYSLSSCDDRDMVPYAESLVEKLIASGQQPTVALYNALLHCLAKSGDRDAPSRALAILESLQQEDSDLNPDIRTYTNVLDCLTNSRDPEAVAKAEALVEQMEQQGPQPTTQTYTTLIQNYARSRLPLKAVYAASVLKRMNETGRTPPSIVTYNAVLNAAEHTDGSDLHVREGALKVACLAFDEIRNSTVVQPNHVTYGSFLGVLTNLMTADVRQHIVNLVFKRCCLDGQVSYLVLKKLKLAVETREQYYQLLMGHNENRLPADWTCNVKEVKARELQ